MRLIAVVLFILLTAAHSPAEGPVVLTLEEAVKLALKNYEKIKVERYSVGIARESIRFQEGAFDPLLSFSIGRSYRQSETTSMLYSAEQDTAEITAAFSGKLSTGTSYRVLWRHERYTGDSVFLLLNPYHQAEFTLTLTQPLLKGRSREIQMGSIKTSEFQLAISRQRLRDRYIQIALQTVELYLGLQMAVEAERLAEFSLHLAREYHKEVKERIKQGLLAPVEVYSIEAEIAERQSHLLSSRTQRQNAEDRLKATLGLSWETEIEIVPYEDYPQRIDPVELYRNTVESSAELKALEYELKVAELQERLFENQLLPELNVSVSYSFTGVGEDSSDAINALTDAEGHNWSVFLSLMVPVGNNSARAEYRIARLKRLQTIQRIADYRKSLELRLRSQFREFELAREMEKSKVKYLNAQQKRYQLEKTRFSLGLTTLNELLKAEEQYLKALMESKKARYELIRAFFKLRATDGGILEIFNIHLEE